MRIALISAISDPYYDYVRKGEKSWEIRLKKGGWENLKKGEAVLLFRHGGRGEFLIVEIFERQEFGSIAEALDHVGIKDAIPQAQSVSEALSEYRRFYSEEKERKYGVVAFRIRVVAEYSGEIHKDLLLKYLPHMKEEC